MQRNEQGTNKTGVCHFVVAMVDRTSALLVSLCGCVDECVVNHNRCVLLWELTDFLRKTDDRVRSGALVPYIAGISGTALLRSSQPISAGAGMYVVWCSSALLPLHLACCVSGLSHRGKRSADGCGGDIRWTGDAV